MSNFWGIFLGIIGFLFLITIHEGGHCFVAKSIGVRVNEFAIGMGPLLASKEKNGTKYSFRLFPIGGFCALQGEFGEDMTDEEIENYVDTDPAAFVNQPAWKQILVMLAGPIVNLIFGFLLLIIVYSIVAAGKVGFARVLQVSFEDVWTIIADTTDFIIGLFKGSSSMDGVTGVIGIVDVITQAAGYGLVNVVYLIALLSVNLFYMNMLPIPGLDGGRILVTIIRTVVGEKFTQKTENIINGIGMIFLLGLIVFIAFKDIIGLF